MNDQFAKGKVYYIMSNKRDEMERKIFELAADIMEEVNEIS